MLLLIPGLLMAAAQAAAAPPPAPAMKTKRICTMQEAITGSITPKRVCVTVPQQASPATAPAAQEAGRDKPPQPAPNASGSSN